MIEKGYALSKESCAKTFGGRTGLGALSGNFRQFGLWPQRAVRGSEKANCHQIQASLIRRQPPFSESLRDSRSAAQPAPGLACAVYQSYLQPRSRNDGGLPTSMLRQQHSHISKSPSLSLLKAGIFLCCGVFLEHDTSQALFNQLAEIA